MTAPWLAVVNPSAGRPRSPRQQRAIADQLARELGAEVVFTEHRGHAEALSAGARTFAGVAVLGGDGTTAEVVNGMDLERQVLLVLAGGTGNSLARDLRLTSLKAAFAAARNARRRTLDLLRVTFWVQHQPYTRLAISTTSVGYAAEVVGLTNHFYKSLGALCYPLAATMQAARQRSFPIVLRVDDGPAREAWLSNVMVNNTCHAANFPVFRQADPSDGQMDVLLARAGCASQLLHNLAVLTRTYLYATAAGFRARQLRLRLPTPQRLMIDGELREGITEVQFEVLAGKLTCIA